MGLRAEHSKTSLGTHTFLKDKNSIKNGSVVLHILHSLGIHTNSTALPKHYNKDGSAPWKSPIVP